MFGSRSRVRAFGSTSEMVEVIGHLGDASPEAPEGASSFEFIRFKQLLERVLGRRSIWSSMAA